MNAVTEEIPKGSYAAGNRLQLPKGAERPISVFINGIEQTENADYRLLGRDIVFSRQIVKEELGKARMLVMFIGLWGSYRKNETVDLHFRFNGETRVISDAKVLPD